MCAPNDSVHQRFPPGNAVEVGEDVFAFLQGDGSWWLNNAGFVVGHRTILGVDSCATESRTKHLVAAIREISDAPVRTLVNTHHHADHTYGNYLFEDAVIIGHERTRSNVLEFGPPENAIYWGDDIEWGAIELTPPSIAIRDSLTVFVDELECQVMTLGGVAHTDNDLMVWIPERSVLFAGDLLFNGGTPFVVSGSLAGLVRALEEEIKPLAAEVIVPGHGPVTDARLIESTIEYLRFVQAVATDAVAAGLEPLAAARECQLGQYEEWLDAERIVANLHRAMAEVVHSPSAVIDVDAAMRDMVAFNGGRPLVTHV